MSEAPRSPDRASWLVRLLGWTASVFFRVERRGEPIPDGPVLVVANHPNSLLDPLVVFRTAGRPTRPLAKAPLFDQKFVGFMLRALGGLPVYRRQDDDAQMHRNEDTFRKAIDALQEGSAVQIFPEGITHSEPSLAPLRTGAARIALAAEAERDWQLGLRIVPIGLTYRHKTRFRGSALACTGTPITVAEWKDAWEADPQAAARELTDTIRARLEDVTLNLSRTEDEGLVETAERIWTRAKGLAGWRERDPLADRLPRLRAFAHGLGWLRLHEPERHDALVRQVRRYRALLERLGVEDGDVPPRYTAGQVARYVLFEGLPLLLGLPFALVGAVLWYPVWIAPRFAVSRIRPEHTAISTYKLVTGFFAAPLLWAILIGIAAWRWGWPGGALAAAAVPLLGFATLAWGERFLRVRDDADLFLRVLSRPQIAAALDARRSRLVTAFDELADRVPEAEAEAGDYSST